MNDNKVSSNAVTTKDEASPKYVTTHNRVSINAITLKYAVSPEYMINDKQVNSNDMTLNDDIQLINLCSNSEIIVSLD